MKTRGKNKTAEKKTPNLIQRTPGGNYIFRVTRTVDGKETQKWISTGTNQVSAAKVERTRLMEEVKKARMSGRWETIGLLKLRTDLPSVNELEVVYKAHIATEAVQAPALKTQGEYFRNLRAVLSRARGITMEEAGELPVTVVASAAGAEVVRQFRAAWLALAPAGDLKVMATRRRSGDSMLNQARAAFGEDARRCYRRGPKVEGAKTKGWEMPDLTGFLEEPGFNSEAKQHVDIEPAVLKEMDKQAREELREKNPRLWLVHLLHKFLGLRNSEIEDARVGWFIPVRWEEGRPIQWMMEISKRLGYQPKASEGSVPLKREVAAELLAAFKLLKIDPEGDLLQHVIPAAHPTERHDVIYKEHAAFIRRFLPGEDFSKAGYELRRWAFRTVQSKYGSREVARAFLRHAMPADAGRHYQARFYAWATLGDDVGLSLQDACGGAASMAAAKVERSAWAELAG